MPGGGVLNPGSPGGSAFCPWGLRSSSGPRLWGEWAGLSPPPPTPPPPPRADPLDTRVWCGARGDPCWGAGRREDTGPQAAARQGRRLALSLGSARCSRARGSDRGGGGASHPSASRAGITHPPCLSASLRPKPPTKAHGGQGARADLMSSPHRPVNKCCRLCPESVYSRQARGCTPPRAARGFLWGGGGVKGGMRELPVSLLQPRVLGSPGAPACS